MNVIAVVVSYNRCELLRTCLAALRAQSTPPQRVLVVDNGSTDGALEMVAQEFPEVEVFRTTSNVGGAGGFAWGVEIAIASGAHDAWLMDDDASPFATALEELILAKNSLAIANIEPSFLASLVVNSSGDDLATHRPPRASFTATDVLPVGVEPIRYASFVGVLVSLKFAKRTALPVPDFFIWHDDLEYTSRLGTFGQGFQVLASRVAHPDKPELNDFGWRLVHDIKNRIWIWRISALGAPSIKRQVGRAVPGTLWFQARSARSKRGFVRNSVKGLTAGLFTRPRQYMPGELKQSTVLETT